MESSNDWIERVREADRIAERLWDGVVETMAATGDVSTSSDMKLHVDTLTATALVSIASELRAKRISERPGGIRRVQP